MKRLLIIVHLFLSNGLNAQFVNITNGSFKLNGQNFFPLVLNYIVQIRKNSTGEYWVEKTLILTTLDRFKLTTQERSMLTTPKRSMLTT